MPRFDRIRSDYRRPVSWWACEFAGVVATVLFFFALFHVLALTSPERMQFQ